MTLLKISSIVFVVGMLGGCGGGGGGGTTGEPQVTGKVSINGLTENICGIELKVAYPATASYKSATAVGNASGSLVVADTTNRSNSVAVTTAASSGFSGNGEVVNVLFSSAVTNGFRVYSTSVRNCSGVTLSSGTFSLLIQ